MDGQSPITHAIPQNVTDFQFHLVGDMTLKQFGYLGGGVGIAYLLFIVLAGPAPFVAWPLIVFFAGSGAALAFLPIQERPLDRWLISFVKAVFKPTATKYQSASLRIEDPRFNDRVNIYLNMAAAPILTPNLPLANQNKLMVETVVKPLVSGPTQSPKTAPVSSTPSPQPETIRPIITKQSPDLATQSTIDLPTIDELKKTVELAKEAQTVQSKIIDTQKQLNQIRVNAATPGADTKAFAQTFQKMLSDLQQLNYQASQISKELAINTKTSNVAPEIKSLPPTKPKIMPTMTLTTTANIINGICLDAIGNYVEGAIIVAHDKQGLPVRALKTNKLGQFIAATPLPNGTYTLNVEKDDLVFDTIQIALSGEVLKPIMISAKKL